VRCLVDKKVPHALTYYKTYMQEPSPAGDISIGKNELSGFDAIDLKTVLSEMKKLGKDGEMLLVTHSDKDGLMMPLVRGGGASVKLSLLNIILQISEGIRQRKAIAALPASTSNDQKAAAWLKWLNTFEDKIDVKAGFHVGNDDWEPTVKKWYTAWYNRQHTTILKLPNAKELDEVIQLVDDVRAAGFARLELRACQIGSDSDELKKMATFFQCKKVVAPKEVMTFYMSVPGVTVAKPDKIEKAVKSNPTARMVAGINVVVIESVHGFQVLALSKEEGKKFIKTLIKTKFDGPDEPFVTGGVEPVGTTKVAGKRYVFPLEKEYKDLLTTVTL
jgi:hypothetical protein